MENFIKAYGTLVKVVSDNIDFFVEKKHLGEDGKFTKEDLPAVVAQFVPLLVNIPSIQVLVKESANFLKPEAKPLLQAAFIENFKTKNELTEVVVEEIHDLILSIIKVVIKISQIKNQ